MPREMRCPSQSSKSPSPAPIAPWSLSRKCLLPRSRTRCLSAKPSASTAGATTSTGLQPLPSANNYENHSPPSRLRRPHVRANPNLTTTDSKSPANQARASFEERRACSEPPCGFLALGPFEFAGISFVKKVLWCDIPKTSDDCWYSAHKGIQYSPAPRSARLFLY
jgi:hypothetical protein